MNPQVRALRSSLVLGFLVFVVALALVIDDAHAQAPKWSDVELAGFSRAILTGRVVGMSSGLDPITGGIYTYVTIEVDEVVKGAISTDRVTIKQMGGVVGELGLAVADQATFANGEDVLVFLEQRPRDNTLYTTALWQGKWTIEQRDGTAVAVRLAEATFHGPPGVQAAAIAGDERLLGSFLAELRSWSADVPVRSTQAAFVTKPSEAPAPNTAPADQGVVVGQFLLFSPAWRYHEADSGTSVPVDIQSGGQTGLSGGGFSEIATARGLWNAVSTATMSLGAGSSAAASRCTTVSTPTGRITISFMDPCGEISDSGGILAVGGSYYSTNPLNQKTINSTVFNKATSGFIVNNNSTTALNYLKVSACFRDIETHELGHVQGLDHSAVSGAIMYPFIDNACGPLIPDAPEGVGSGAITGALGQDDKDGLTFIYPLSTPAAVTLVSPIGGTTTSDTTPTYTWNATSAATWYYLWVEGPTGDGVVITQWVAATSAGCGSGTGTCSTTPTTVLFSGAHRWWIRSWNASGYGPWSPRGDFTVASLPSATTLVSPIGNSVTADNTPTYTWNAVSGSTWYYLWVDGPGGNVMKTWFSASQAGCSGGTGTCSTTPSTVLPDGDYDWWVRTWNSTGYGPWSARGDFSVQTGPPGQTTLIYPISGFNTPSNDPNFQWNAVSGSTWYYLWVDGPNGFHFVQWISAAQALCSSGTGTCQFVASTSLTELGTHDWWIRTWNASGYGPWSAKGTWVHTSSLD